MAQRHLRIELYSMHAHIENGTVDYVSLFDAILPTLAKLHYEEGTRHVAFGQASKVGNRIFLIAYTGYDARAFLLFDVNRQQELFESIQPGRFHARKTHALLDPRQRFLLIENRKGHLRPDDLANAIELVARKLSGYETLELEFNPVAEGEFVRQIEQFQRIQQATITLARPNVDWSERHHQLTEVADESDAKAIDVTVRAKREKSIAKDNGLIQFVKQFAALPQSIFKRISITGSRDDDAGLITLNLSKHVEHIDLLADLDSDTGQPNESEVRNTMESYLASKEKPPDAPTS
jgi:hypothetical protein